MRADRILRVITYGALLAAAIVTFVIPDGLSIQPATAWNPPDVVYVNGMVRDFRQSHPDFDVLPAAGDGHYAGNVRLTLTSDGRPAFAGTGINSDSGQIPAIDLIAHWPFDDGGGTTADDDVGANDGALVGGAAWTTGKIGGALHFDGVDDHVSVPNSAQMQITGDITFAGWFKLDSSFNSSSPDTQLIMEKFLDVDHDFHVALAGLDYNRPEVPKGALTFKVENGPTSDYYCYVWTNRTSWNVGEWYHFAASLKSGDTAQNKIFINGVDDTNSVIAAGVGFLDTDYDAPMRIGGKTIDYNGYATDIYFDGAIDEVMIFGRTVNESDFVLPGEGGYKVDIQWRDSAGRNLAPHLAAAGTDSLRVSSAPSISDTAIFDSWDSSAGPYGGSNIGPPPPIETGGAPLPVVLPADMPPSSGKVDFDSTNPVIDADVTCSSLTIDDTVTVVGDVRILVSGAVSFSPSALLQFAPGASLTIWAGDKLDVLPQAVLNPDGDPRDLILYALGDKGITLGNPMAQIWATVIAPNSVMTCQSHSQFFGTYTGAGLDVNNHAQYHHDGAANFDACNVIIADSIGAAGLDSSGAITSTATFAQWFRDVLGTNLSASHTIPLTDIGGGIYEFQTADFHPIDGRLLGNEGETHNYYLTYTFTNRFTYAACQQQFFQFEGADDAWLFIDGRLVMDLGGIRARTPQYVDLDRLGLVDGEQYTLRFFYAQRQSFDTAFHLRTNLLFEGSDPVVASGGWD